MNLVATVQHIVIHGNGLIQQIQICITCLNTTQSDLFYLMVMFNSRLKDQYIKYQTLHSDICNYNLNDILYKL